MKTIPELAEDLRAHINTDNDAKRLIVEHVLPLVGVEVDSLGELLGMQGRITELSATVNRYSRNKDAAEAAIREALTALDSE